MKNRRILIVTNRIPYPLKDGGNLAMYTMIDGYYKAGWDVFLLSMNTSRHYVAVEELPELFQQIQLETFDIDTDIKLVPSLKNYFLSKQPNQAERFFDKDFEKKLLKVIADFDPEFIQLESVYLNVYLPSIREVVKTPVAIRLHNIEHQIWERLGTETSNLLKRKYLKDLAARIQKFELNAWKEADLLIPITDADADYVKSTHVKTPLHVASFGIDSCKAKQKITEHEKWIGYHIGAMDWMPNIEAMTWFLENVWKELHKELPEFEFHFAGRNMPASFKKYEGNGIVCAGEVADAHAFIADKKLLIVSLQAGSGIRVKIMEALAQEKLVISTSVGVQGINGLEAGKHFLLAETAEDFIKQISFAIHNKEAAKAIAHSGAQLIYEHYNQKRITESLCQTIITLMDKNSRPVLA
jgi:glycosyltransferase involved in cell wall biosynthesis